MNKHPGHPIIVTVCGDPGGANAIAPVIKLLEEECNVQVFNYSYNQAVDILKRFKIESIVLWSQARDDIALEILKEHKSTLLLTATSVNEKDWEKLFISSARDLNIYSVAILDFWSNYGARFSDGKGKLNKLPDKIAVMDDYAKSEIIANGIPAERVMITGQPAFDSLSQYRDQFSHTLKKSIRTVLRISDDDLLVMFASQPLRKQYGEPGDSSYLGYDERSTLNYIIGSLETINQKYNRNITLLIRPHPQETVSEYMHYQSNKIKIIVSMEGNNRNVVMAVDLVLGMTTVLLVEACYLGCVVLSLQPGLCKPDVLPTNRWGVSIPIYREEEMTPVIEQYLLDKHAREVVLGKALAIPSSASRQIVDYLYTIN